MRSCPPNVSIISSEVAHPFGPRPIETGTQRRSRCLRTTDLFPAAWLRVVLGVVQRTISADQFKEARILQGLDHANVVKVYDIIDRTDDVQIVMW